MATPSPEPTPRATPTPFPLEQIRLFFSKEVPPGLIESIVIPEAVRVVEDREEANVIFESISGEVDPTLPISEWRYVVAAPFPRGSIIPDLPCSVLITSHDTASAFLGTSPHSFHCGSMEPTGGDTLFSTAASTTKSYALIPFDKLSKSWQLRAGEDFREADRIIRFSLSGDQQAIDALSLNDEFFVPATNFDPLKLTSVILTGTTALTRGTGKLMDEKGNLFPAEKIGELLRNAMSLISVTRYHLIPVANWKNPEPNFAANRNISS